MFGLGLFSFATMVAAGAALDPSHRQLRVSENRHFLMWDDGRPFFYLGDTAWELFHRLDREQAARYLDDRAAKGFTVIQAVALAELDGLNTPNAYGHRPLRDNNPATPWTEDGEGNDYWDHVDHVIHAANQRGLLVALLPSWGDKWNLASWGTGPTVFTPDNAEAFGRWIGARYGTRGVIWMMGGDRSPADPAHRTIIDRMATGVRAGDPKGRLMTFHPPGGQTSSAWWHDSAWLDFNARQNGHQVEYERYGRTLEDYQRLPTKPVIDAEPVYEDHPVDFKPGTLGYTVAADVRRTLYWNLFNGACGHTYGHHSVWQMYEPPRQPVNGPLLTWDRALQQPGASQMQHARWLIESRPCLTRIPDPELVLTQTPDSAWPGQGRYRFVGTRDEAGSYAFIYAPVGRSFKVNLEALSGTTLRAWWYNPRTGEADPIGEFARTHDREFISPSPGELLDWVLVLDDAARNYPAPGARRK